MLIFCKVWVIHGELQFSHQQFGTISKISTIWQNIFHVSRFVQPMTHTLWLIIMTHKLFQGKIIMSFCMQVPAYRRLPVEIRNELLSKSINELTVLFLSCNFNKKLQIIQFDDTEIDDRKGFQSILRSNVAVQGSLWLNQLFTASFTQCSRVLSPIVNIGKNILKTIKVSYTMNLV